MSGRDATSSAPVGFVRTKKLKFTANVSLDALQAPASEAPSVDLVNRSGPYDPVEAEMNRQHFKLTVICAHCEYWYIGRDKDLVDHVGKPACAAPTNCGGLTVRLGYPSYKGPFSLEHLKQHCAVCGEKAPRSVSTSDGREIGYCETHLEQGAHVLATRLERR